LLLIRHDQDRKDLLFWGKPGREPFRQAKAPVWRFHSRSRFLPPPIADTETRDEKEVNQMQHSLFERDVPGAFLS
jgi:hypothetical protein